MRVELDILGLYDGDVARGLGQPVFHVPIVRLPYLEDFVFKMQRSMTLGRKPFGLACAVAEAGGPGKVARLWVALPVLASQATHKSQTARGAILEKKTLQNELSLPEGAAAQVAYGIASRGEGERDVFLRTGPLYAGGVICFKW